MMLYTIIDQQELFYQQKNFKYCYKRVENCMVEGVKYKDGGICVNRIISTDLKHYLNPTLQPGSRFTTGTWHV